MMEEKLWFIFFKNDVLLEKKADSSYAIPRGSEPPVAVPQGAHVLSVRYQDDEAIRTFCVDQPIEMPGYELCGLRASYYKLSHDLYLKAGKCHELVFWDNNTHFCSTCGAPMEMHTDISKRCTKCGREVWPQLATAIIVLIHRGDEVLLVHAKNFKTDFYGLVAGFVETGETLEEAVRREVMEETGLTIKNLTYFGSQPWPYPCGLMVGFMAEYVSGDVTLQYSELSKGGWFNRHHLPQLPEKLSIARRIIDHWLKGFSD